MLTTVLSDDGDIGPPPLEGELSLKGVITGGAGLGSRRKWKLRRSESGPPSSEERLSYSKPSREASCSLREMGWCENEERWSGEISGCIGLRLLLGVVAVVVVVVVVVGLMFRSLSLVSVLIGVWSMNAMLVTGSSFSFS